MTLPPFQSVVDQHGDDLHRFCLVSFGRDRADDLYQETMLAALAAYPSLRDAAAVRGWLWRIAARKAVDGFRRSSRAAVPVADPDPGATPDAPGADPELWSEVRGLPPKQRLAVGYRFVLDLPFAEVAELMGTSEEAARRNVHEALKRLRARLGDAA